jgi:hypothetical protein
VPEEQRGMFKDEEIDKISHSSWISLFLFIITELVEE